MATRDALDGGAAALATRSALDVVPAQLWLIVSRGLQAMAAPIIALLIAMGGGGAGTGEEAISFCNVLFVGNLCASGVVGTTFGWRRIVRDLAALPRPVMRELWLFGGLSAALSTLLFVALETTTVTNAVVLARLGPVLYALGGVLLLGAALRRSEWIGFGLVLVGVAWTAAASWQAGLAEGDGLILLSAAVFAGVQLSSKRLLPHTGLPALVFARNLCSALIFFVIAVVAYGPGHFADAFSGSLWGVMTVYALVVIVAAQLAWYRALDRLRPASVARWTVIGPLMAVGLAYLISGEHPSPAQLTGLAFVSVGILTSARGAADPMPSSEGAENSLAAS